MTTDASAAPTSPVTEEAHAAMQRMSRQHKKANDWFVNAEASIITPYDTLLLLTFSLAAKSNRAAMNQNM